MAYHTIEDGPWPKGTTVTAWPASSVVGGAPVGAPVASGVASADGVVELGGLTEGATYVAFGSGGSQTFQAVNQETRLGSLESSAGSYTIEEAGITAYATATAADAGADYTTLLNLAAATAKTLGRKLVSGKGGFVKVTSTFDFANIDLDLSNLTLRVDLAYPLGAETPAIRGWEQTSPFRIRRRTLKLPRVENADRGGATARWVTAGASQNDIGVQLVSCEACEIDVPEATDFSIGLDTEGNNSSGFSYNTVRLGSLLHNRINHRLGKLDSTGWCNSNVFIAGTYNHFDSETTLRTSGVRHVYLAAGNFDTEPNHNVWIGSAFEGIAAEYEIESWGSYNEWRGCRWEKSGSNARAWWRGTGSHLATGNIIDRGYQAAAVTHTNDASTSRNVVQSATRYENATTGPVLDFYGAAQEDTGIRFRVSGDAQPRVAISSGGVYFGDSAGAMESRFTRFASGVVQFEAFSGSRTSLRIKRRSGQTTSDDLLFVGDESNVQLFGVTKDGRIRNVSGNEGTTVGAAGGASALPATPTGYFKIVDSGGTARNVPYYA